MVGEITDATNCKIICGALSKSNANRITITIVGRAITLKRAIKINSNSNIEKK